MNENRDIQKKPSPSSCCEDIYSEEIGKCLKTLKRFREHWLKSSASWNSDLFQYADQDFYFYRFAIDRQEKSTEYLLNKILCRVMERYGINFQILERSPFAFLICNKEGKIGYRFSYFYSDENVNRILRKYRLKKAYIISTRKPGLRDNWIEDENKHFKENGLQLETITLARFFEYYFTHDEYEIFSYKINEYIESSKDILGYKSIKFLTSMNLSTQRIFEEKLLADWDYKKYRYQIINPLDIKIQKYLYLSQTSFSDNILDEMQTQYVLKGFYKSILGNNEYSYVKKKKF